MLDHIIYYSYLVKKFFTGIFKKKEIEQEEEDVTGLGEELNQMKLNKIDISQARLIVYTSITKSKRCPMCNHIIFKNGWETKVIQMGNVKIFTCPYCKTELEIK
jgi:hypothetical protein